MSIDEKATDSRIFNLADSTAKALYPVLSSEEKPTGISFAGGGRQVAKDVANLKCIHTRVFDESTGINEETHSCTLDVTSNPDIVEDKDAITITGSTAEAFYNAMTLEPKPLPVMFQGGGSRVEKKVAGFACTFTDTFDESTGQDVKIYACRIDRA
jgi:hypothetical protein